MQFKQTINKTAFCLLFTLLTYTMMAQTNGYMLHTILKGETLSSIAKQNNVSVGDIMRLNKMTSTSILSIGSSIKLPIADNTKIKDETVKLNVKTNTNTKAISPLNESNTTPLNNNTNLTNQSNSYQVVKGDNIYKLSKKFNVTEAQLREWNGLKDNQLSLGQTIIVSKKEPISTISSKIEPLIKTPNTTTTSSYTVVKGDNLYKISKLLGVSESELMTWNGMPNNNLSLGQVLLIKKGINHITADTVITEIKKNKLESAIIPSKKSNTPEANTVIKQTTVEQIDTTEAVNTNTPNTIGEHKKDSTINKRLSKLPTVEEDVKAIPKYEKYVNNEGYYAAYFDRKGANQNTKFGVGAIIKSASGWSDKKFFVLTNEISIGKIVRVTVNNKSICAKVIGELPNVNGENKLLLRVNSAAAQALDIKETRFNVTLNFN